MNKLIQIAVVLSLCIIPCIILVQVAPTKAQDTIHIVPCTIDGTVEWHTFVYDSITDGYDVCTEVGGTLVQCDTDMDCMNKTGVSL